MPIPHWREKIRPYSAPGFAERVAGEPNGPSLPRHAQAALWAAAKGTASSAPFLLPSRTSDRSALLSAGDLVSDPNLTGADDLGVDAHDIVAVMAH